VAADMKARLKEMISEVSAAGFKSKSVAKEEKTEEPAP